MNDHSTASTDSGEVGSAGSLSKDEAQSAFARFLSDDAGPSEKAEAQTEQPVDEEVPADQEEAPEDPSQEEETPEAPEDDDQEVLAKVDGEERKFKVKDLIRLAGQEAALTRKSQEVAEARKKAEEQLSIAEKTTRYWVERAEAEHEPFKNLDFIDLAAQVAAGELKREDFTALRTEYLRTHQQLQMVTKGYTQLNQAVSAEHEAKVKAAVAEARKAVAQEGKHHIRDFSDTTLTKMGEFLTDLGVPASVLETEGNPGVLKLIDMAMAHQRTQKAAAEVRKLTKATPAAKIPPRDNGSGRFVAQNPAKAALSRLSETGSIEDATAAFRSLL